MRISLCAIVVAGVLLAACRKESDTSETQFNVSIDTSSYVSARNGQTVKLTAKVDVEGDYTYRWYDNEVDLATGQEVSFTLKGEGLHRISVSAEDAGGKLLSTSSVDIFAGKSTEYKVVGYYPDWKLSNPVRWNRITHLCYAFLVPESDGEVNQEIGSKTAELVKEGHANGTYMLISVGGASTSSFSTAILNPQARANLVKNITGFVVTHNFDGADIDFEEWEGGPEGASAADLEKRTALEAFYKELRAALPSDRLLTAAVNPSWKNPYWGYYACYTPGMARYLDFIGLMIYDQTGTWSTSPYGQHAGMDHFRSSFNHWKGEMGVPGKKLIGGVPFYGYKFKDTNGGLAEAVAYSDIVRQYPDEMVQTKDNVGLIFYNGVPTMQEKCSYVKSNGLGGIMIWELTQDTDSPETSLLDAISISLLAS